MSVTSKFQRLMIEAVPFRVGHRVTISPTCKYAGEWPGEYVITGMRWRYQDGHEIDFSIASDDEIIHRHGDTDGFRACDLVPVSR